MSTLTADFIFEQCLRPPPQKWFGFRDCVWRYFLSLLGFYFCLVTTPISFAYYTYRFNIVWYGNIFGRLIFCWYPVMPLAILCIVGFEKLKSLFEASNWMTDGPGRVFFITPPNPIASFVWSLYLNQSMFVGQFLLAGTNDDAIQHTWYDTILTKDFWRAALDRVKARVPRELGRWNGTSYEQYHAVDNTDIVVKLPDSYLGMGDSFWNNETGYGVKHKGAKADFKTQADLEAKMKETYQGQEAMVLELVRPKPGLGVHSIDIITMRTPQDEVKVLTCLLWTDCTTDSSHSCRAGYTVDVETEIITGAAVWYSVYFATMDTPLIGTKMPGVKKACAQCVAAHQAIDEKWLVAVGWDGMVMEDDEVVFFEGNFAGARTPRRMFLNWTCFYTMITKYFWPFGSGNSAQPGRQAYGKSTKAK